MRAYVFLPAKELEPRLQVSMPLPNPVFHFLYLHPAFWPCGFILTVSFQFLLSFSVLYLLSFFSV